MVTKEPRFRTMEDSPNSMSDETCGTMAAIQRAPMTAVLIGFGAGLAVGCLALRAAMQTRREKELSTAERLGKSILDALGGVMPEAVSKRFGG